MKQLTRYAIGTMIALAPWSLAWAQQQDLEVTMHVVPANASAGAATGEIKLPGAAAPRAQESSAFGLETANRARELRGELGREFGKEVSEAARERARGPGTASTPRRP